MRHTILIIMLLMTHQCKVNGQNIKVYPWFINSDTPTNAPIMLKGQYYNWNIVVENRNPNNINLVSDSLQIIRCKFDSASIFNIMWKKGNKGHGDISAYVYDKAEYIGTVVFHFADSTYPPEVKACLRKFPLIRNFGLDSLCIINYFSNNEYNYKILSFVVEIRDKDNNLLFSEYNQGHILSDRFKKALLKCHPVTKVFFKHIIIINDEGEILYRPFHGEYMY